LLLLLFCFYVVLFVFFVDIINFFVGIIFFFFVDIIVIIHDLGMEDFNRNLYFALNDLLRERSNEDEKTETTPHVLDEWSFQIATSGGNSLSWCPQHSHEGDSRKISSGSEYPLISLHKYHQQHQESKILCARK
jgi:hypothetical protein